MYVNEFSRRLGLPASKVRYYDRSGLYQSRRGSNNYRDFTDQDALDAYLVQSLRSIDLSMEESLQAIRGEDQCRRYDRLSGRIESLRDEIARAKDKLERLERLRDYSSVEDSLFSGERADLYQGPQGQAFYSIRTFGSYAKVNDEVLEIAAVLGQCMPYSYIALTIPEESFLSREEDLPVGVGLGILESNMARCGIAPSPVMDRFPGGPHLGLFMEREDVFHLKGSDLQPFFEAAEANRLRVFGNVVGRVSFVREKDGRRCYGLSLRCQTAPL